MKKCILIQGPSNHVNEIKSSFKDHDLIFSTWCGEESKYEESDIVIFNDHPPYPGHANFWHQKISTLNGLLKCKELGYTHVLKIRSDIISTKNDIFELFDDNKLNFLCWHYHEVYPNCKGYLVDYFMYGCVDKMIKMWDIKEMFCKVPEVVLTESFIQNLNEIPNFILYDMKNDYELYWIKNNIYLSSYVNVLYPDKYKKYDFGETIEHLNGNYLNDVIF